MISKFIEETNEHIKTVCPIGRVEGIAEIINILDDEDEKSAPCIYEGNQSYKNVWDNGHSQGLLYHQINGDIIIEDLDNPATISDNEQRIRYPIRTVYAIPKDLVNGVYADIDISLMVMDAITTFDKKAFSKSNNISIEKKINSSSVNRDNIITTELPGLDIHYNYSVGSIEWEITMEGLINCILKTICDE